MKNISEGGLAIKLVDPVKLKGVVVVEFKLPSVESQTFSARADVVWSDSFVLGLRFLYVEKHSEGTLRALARFVRVPTSFSRIGGTHLLIKNCNSSSLELRWYRFSLSWRRDRNYFDSCAGGDAVGGVVCTERFSPRRRGRQDTGSPRVPRCTLHHAPTVRPPGRIIVDIPMATRTLGS